MSAPYFQIPGEFANDGETFNKLKQEYQEIHAFSTSNEYLNFIEGKVMADFNTLMNRRIMSGLLSLQAIPQMSRRVLEKLHL